MITHVCILGERVSGTSFVQSLFNVNTTLKPNSSFGHKHFFQDVEAIQKMNTSHILFVLVTRDIIEWLQSFKNSTFHADIPIRNCTNLSKFIRMEWKCIEDETSGVSQMDKKYGTEMLFERDPLTGNRFSNVIQMRTCKINHWMSLKNIVPNFVHIRYEDVRDDPEDFLVNICQIYGICRHREFNPVKSVRGKGRVEYVRKNYPEISQEDINFILEELDEDSESLIGYT